MRAPLKPRSALDRAFSIFRKDDGRKADAIFVCKLYQTEDGGWDTEACFRHWIKNLPPDQKNQLPAGAPGAIIAAVTAKPLQKHVGNMLKNAASAFISPHLGENAAGVVGSIIDTFTEKKD